MNAPAMDAPATNDFATNWQVTNGSVTSAGPTNPEATNGSVTNNPWTDSMDTTAAPDALRADGIVKRFGPLTALSGVSLQLRPGEILGILGDNGAGKSTLMKILTGFLPPTEGKLFVHGEILYPGPFRLLNNRAMRRQAEQCLEQIGVHVPSVTLPVERLSGGQRQAIAVARAVNSKARVLLLDEPLAAMGAREAGLIIDLILRLKAAGGLSIIMIMHNYAQTLEIADHIMLMQRGRVTYENRAQSTSVEELMEIVRREYRTARNG